MRGCEFPKCRNPHKGHGLCATHLAQRKRGVALYAVTPGHGDGSRSHPHYLWSTWRGIKNRCLNPYTAHFEWYGARGITLYPEWIPPLSGYVAFRTWILANLGERPEGRSLDRIDNDGNYEPGNLRWATAHEQAMTRRSKWRDR